MFTTKCSGMSATTQICYFPATNLSSSFLKFTLLLSGSQHFSWTLLCSPAPLCDLVNSAIKLHILDPLIPKWSTGSSFLYPKKRNTLWQYRNLARWFLLRWKKEKTKNGEWIGCGRCASGMVVRSRAGLFDLIFENYSGFSQWQASLIWSCIHRYKSIQKAIAFFFFYYSVERASYESFSSVPQSHSWVCSAHECFLSEHTHPQKYAHKASSDQHDA